MIIEKSEYEGVTYYQMTSRGVDYTLRCHNDDEWELHSKRKALGRSNIGLFRFFKTLQEIEDTLKSFKGITKLIEDK